MSEQILATPRRHDVAARLMAFDSAWQRGEADLADFLPAEDDPIYDEVLRELIRHDLRQRWQHGHPVRLDRYRRSFPAMFERSTELAELAFEEYRQRVLAGELVTAEEYRRSYGIDTSGWPLPHAVTPEGPGNSVTDLARELGLGGDLPPLSVSATMALRRLVKARHRFPKSGDSILDFVLLRELGRGSFGRVFLARQTHLADRPVVLKISPQLDAEPQRLAQLQHTNIVPIYSVHQSGSLQLVCMPYFGSVTLAQVKYDLGISGQHLPATGREFLTTLFQRAAALVTSEVESLAEPVNRTLPVVPRSPGTLDMLGAMTYVDAVLWMGARIAAALAHAHERGILHCDLKPDNILLTDDGQPMLLDFNVSVDSKVTDILRVAKVGGTLPYMAPERLESVRRTGRSVDGRSDLYSLGVILYRMLTGFAPYDTPIGPMTDLVEQVLAQRSSAPIPPRRLNPAITPAVDSIIRKLLETDPDRRYARAADLQEDLERHLSDRPLRFAKDPSPVERLRKWRRRHPRLATAAVAMLVVFFGLVLPGGLTLKYLADTAARRRGNDRAAAVLRKQGATDDARMAMILLSTRSDQALLSEGFEHASKALGAFDVTGESDWTAQPAFQLLQPQEQRDLRLTMGELLMLMARGELLRDAKGLQAALRWNRLAEASFPPGECPRYLARQRADMAARLGQPAPPVPEPVPGAGAELDAYYDAFERATAGDSAAALDRLRPFTDKHPRHFMAWYVRGMAHESQREYADAAAAFTICTALEPEFPWSYYNRGIVRLRQQRYTDAQTDFTKSLSLKPGWTSAQFNRALAFDGQRNYAAAEAELTDILKRPDAPTRAWFLRASVRRKAGNKAGADTDLAEGMKLPPADALSWNTRGFARKSVDPAAALADFEEALKLDPRLWEAMENRALVLADFLNRPAEAVAALDGLLKTYPDYVNARAGRGVYLARLGEKERATRDADNCLREDQSPFRLYQMAGLFAQLFKHDGDKESREQALRLAARAFRTGFADFEMIRNDPDITPLKDDPEFKRLLGHARGLQDKR